MRLLPCLIALLFLPACSIPEPSSTTTDPSPVATAEQALSGTFYDMTERLSPADLARWNTARAGLFDSFDDVCSDTFCEGDYSDLSTVAITCSANDDDRVKECGWVLAGSIEYVDGATGKFSYDTRTFNCKIPVKSKTTDFLQALEDSASDVHEPLPATGMSFYDGIRECLAGVVGDLPPPNTGTTYQEIADYFNDHGDPAFWFGTRRRLVSAFDAACAGGACSSTWANVAGLRFVCSTDQTTGEVASCRFTIGAANPSVDPTTGRVAADRKVLRCHIKVKGPAADVEAALDGPDPLNAPLPGAPAPIAVQLQDCL